MEIDLDILKTIQKTEVSPFLYTRIITRIQNRVTEKVPVKWVWAAAISAMIILCMNLAVIISNSKSATTDLTEAFHLNTNNTLYNE